MKQIQFIRDSCQDAESNLDWEAIENGSYFENINVQNSDVVSDRRLLNRPNREEVMWNQSYNINNGCEKSYNKFCPNWYTPVCGRTYAGCTAIAMAQIMWYWQWPHTGMIYSGIDKAGKPTGTQSLHIYDWNLMPCKLNNDTPVEEADMVAGFIRDCGYAAHIEYGPDGSYASLKEARTALINTFAYSEDIVYKRKALSTNSAWIKKLKDNIDQGYPVLYAGYGSGGHAFVVDGYNSENRFHINWGWGNKNKNGYFLLNDLTPPENHNYNSNHEALFNIKPAPSCVSINVNGGTNYRIGTAGAVTVANQTVPSGTTAVYYSGTSVRLLPGFKATEGSHLHVAIQNFPCNGIAPASFTPMNMEDIYDEPESSESKENVVPTGKLCVLPNPTDDILTIESLKEMKNIEIYSMHGEKIMESHETTLNLYNLQAGMYIIIIHFADGTFHSEKIMKRG